MQLQQPTKRVSRLPAVQGLTLAVLIFIALGVLFYAAVLSGLRTFPDGDFTHHFLPFSLFQQQEMLAGRLPIWNPYTYGGHPFLADVQAAVFYPVSTLLLAVTLPWRDTGMRLYFLQLEAVLQVVLAGIFTFVLARQLTGSFWAGLLGGVSLSRAIARSPNVARGFTHRRAGFRPEAWRLKRRRPRGRNRRLDIG